MSDRTLLRFTLAAAVAVACGLFFYNPAHGQATKAHGYEWQPSDYGGFSLVHEGKVVGVLVGKTYFHVEGKTWVQADIPSKAPPVPAQLPAPKPIPPPVVAPAASCPATGCGTSGCVSACGAATGSACGSFRHVLHLRERVTAINPLIHQPVRGFLRRFGRHCG